MRQVLLRDKEAGELLLHVADEEADLLVMIQW